ncbi:MAG: hypothetical protein E7222_12895 [Clostridiales bacterium]|nr:hypothetical protein [Clostridiales bacterium]
MNKKAKTGLKRILAILLANTMILSLIVVADVLYPSTTRKAHAAESTAMGTNQYTTGDAGGLTLSVGSTYSFGGYNWIVAEDKSGYYVLQSKGVTGGTWPGYKMSKFGSSNSYYSSSIDGQDISNYDTTMSNLYNSIKAAEYTSASYGTGLYLVTKEMVGNSTSGGQAESDLSLSGSKQYYHSALKAAANAYSSFGASSNAAWLGTVYCTSYAWYVNGNGNVGNSHQSNSYVVAPAFNLAKSKAKLSGTTIIVATFENSTAIEATQSKQSVSEGETVELSSIISGVKYKDGTNKNKSASFTVSITAGNGDISGTKWTAPTGINANKSVTLTIKDAQKGLTTTKTVTVQPRAAKSITVDKNSSFPETVKVGESVDLSDYITVTGYDTGSQSDGLISNYSLSVDSAYGTISGTTYTPDGVSVTKDVSITVTPTGNLGDVNYTGTQAAFTIRVKPDINDWSDRDENTDELGFHTYKDPTTDITWKFRYNNDGNILHLYTEDDVENIISDGHVLLVPSSINGVSVVGIGGGSKSGSVIPFIPTSGEKANNTWTSIYIPSSIKVINDGAFYQNKASAEIVIPGNVSQIGVNAFKESKITSVVFNDAKKLSLNTEAFADIPTLKNVTFRGNGVTIKQRAFSNDTGITQIDIPNGTKFKGEVDQNDSYAFQGTTGLTLIKIDTDTVYSNTFSANKKLAKVIFGKNVNRVKYDWSGTATSNADTLSETVNRSTYSLNGDTVFEMNKTTGGSPFGYAGSLTIVGQGLDLNSATNTYSDTSDPVTAKVAYLEKHYKETEAIAKYAKGTASSITITVENDPSENEEVTSTISSKQTGIEAYYDGIIFSGKKLEKDKTSVYKMYGDIQNGKYESEEFYVLRTDDADTLLATVNTNQESAANGGEYVSKYTDQILADFTEKDDITITEADVEAGTVDTKVVVLKKDNNGDILIDHSTGFVKAFVYAMAVPVKQYTAENDFLENYGSYNAVISKIDSLSTEVATLKDSVKDKEDEVSKLSSDKEKLQSQYDELVSLKEADEQTISELSEQIAEKTTALETSNKELNDFKAQLVEYANAYNSLAAELKKYISETDTDNSGYFGTVETTDPQTGEKTQKDVVYIDGEPYVYNKTNESVSVSGKDYDVFAGNGDLDNDGTPEDFRFIVTPDGVTILEEMDDGNGNKQYVPGETYADTIGVIQRKAAAQLAAVSSELEKLKGQITDLDKQIADLQKEVSSLENQVSSLEAENEQLKKDKTDLEKKNEELQKELDALKEANAKALAEANAKAKELEKQLEEQKEAAEAAKAALEDENATADQKLDAAEKQIKALNTNVATLEQTNSELQANLSKANVHVETLEKEAEKYVETLTTIANATGADATNPKDIIAKVQAQATTIEEVKEALGTTDVDELGKQVKTVVAAASGDTTDLQKQVTSLTSEKKALQAQVDSLTKDLEDAKKSSGSSKEDAEKIADLTKKNTELKSENDSLKTLKVSLEAQVANLKVQLEQAKANGGSDSSTVAALTTTINNLTSSNKNLSEQVTTLKSANETLTTQLSSAKSQISDLEKDNKALTSDNETLKDTLSTTKKSLTSSRTKVDSLTKRNSTLKKKNKTLTEKNENLQEKNTSMKTERTQLRSQVSTLKNQLAQAKVNTNHGASNYTNTGSGTTTATSSPATGSATKPRQSSKGKSDDKKKDEESDEDDDKIEVSGGAGALNVHKNSNAVGDVISMDLPEESDVDENNVTALEDTSYVDKITTNGKSISDTTFEQKQHANSFFSFFAANELELSSLGVQGIENADTLAIQGIASFDMIPSDEQAKAIEEGKTVSVEVGYDGLIDGEDYLVIHESEVRAGAFDVQVVTAQNHELDFELKDLSPISFAHIEKNAESAITVSSTLSGDGDSKDASEQATQKTEKGKMNRGLTIALVLLVLFLAMGGFLAFSIIRAKKNESSGSFKRKRA